MENTYAVIMAGGAGTRFWPKSRKALPKQYLNLFGKETMIQMVAKRLHNLLPKERIYVVSTKEQEPLLRSQLDWLPPLNIIYEPFGKNTAPCIGLSAIFLNHRDPDAVMIVLPADHLIRNTERFLEILSEGVSLVREFPNALTTIGIQPTYPATGYGYIQKGDKVDGHDEVYQVRAFAEKPTLDVAEKFFASGEFFWNSGIFIWQTKTILTYLESLMPDLYQGLCQIKAAMDKDNLPQVIETVYKQIRSDSIDYGVMEKASNVLVLKGDFGWSDVGSWEEVYNISEKDADGNVVKGKPIYKDVTNSYIEVGDRVVAVIGVDDLIIVDTEDALLICKKDKSQEVKWVVEKLKHQRLKKYL